MPKADMDPVPAQVGGKGRSKGVLPPSCQHPSFLSQSYLPDSGGAPQPQDIKCKDYNHYVRFLALFLTLNSLKIVSVHLFHFTVTCHVVSVHSFPLSHLLRFMLAFHLRLTEEPRSLSWTSHTLEWSLLCCLGFFFLDLGLHVEHEIANIQEQPQLSWAGS